MTSELDFILGRHGAPDVATSICCVLMNIKVYGAKSQALQSDLAAYFRKSKPGYFVIFEVKP